MTENRGSSFGQALELGEYLPGPVLESRNDELDRRHGDLLHSADSDCLGLLTVLIRIHSDRQCQLVIEHASIRARVDDGRNCVTRLTRVSELDQDQRTQHVALVTGVLEAIFILGR